MHTLIAFCLLMIAFATFVVVIAGSIYMISYSDQEAVSKKYIVVGLFTWLSSILAVCLMFMFS